MTTPVLIVEDEPKLAELLRDYLRDAGFETAMLHRGDEVLPWLARHTPRLILLDLMLPGMDGMTVCREFRKTSNIPVIMVTARVEEIDRLLGLELGADDYICKPYSPREVIARVKAVLRRFENTAPATAGLRLDEAGYRVRFGSAQAELSAVEFNLFKVLYSRPGRIFSRDQLMSQIYADHRVVSGRTIDSHIKKLRQKLAGLGLAEEPIHSVYGVGYKYE